MSPVFDNMYQAYQAVVAIKHSKLLSDTSLPYKKNARLYHPFELKEYPHMRQLLNMHYKIMLLQMEVEYPLN